MCRTPHNPRVYSFPRKGCFVSNEQAEKESLLRRLQEEVAQLLCSDVVSEEEKLRRIKRAREIFENMGGYFEFS